MTDFYIPFYAKLVRIFQYSITVIACHNNMSTGFPFRPISRITTGFFLASLSMAYAAIVQHLIYTKPPCYTFPKKCPASNDGLLGNNIHVAIQTPAYLFIGLSEIFTSITGLEYAYTKAPASMKSFVTALFLLTTALGAALGIAISPTAKNPKLVVSGTRCFSPSYTQLSESFAHNISVIVDVHWLGRSFCYCRSYFLVPLSPI